MKEDLRGAAAGHALYEILSGMRLARIENDNIRTTFVRQLEQTALSGFRIDYRQLVLAWFGYNLPPAITRRAF